MSLKKDNLLLYLITDNRWESDNTPLYKQVEKAVLNGVTIVQYREKNLKKSKYIEQALKIKEICKIHNVPFIINDNPYFAKKIDADGVHVGQDDMPVIKTREILGANKIIGTSAHNIEEAQKAEQEGADYIGVGAVFGSNTKTNVSKMTPEFLKKIANSVSIPVVAIGGINENNIDLLHNTNISGIAVISAILSKKDIETAANILKEKARGVVYGRV